MVEVDRHKASVSTRQQFDSYVCLLVKLGGLDTGMFAGEPQAVAADHAGYVGGYLDDVPRLLP